MSTVLAQSFGDFLQVFSGFIVLVAVSNYINLLIRAGFLDLALVFEILAMISTSFLTPPWWLYSFYSISARSCVQAEQSRPSDRKQWSLCCNFCSRSKHRRRLGSESQFSIFQGVRTDCSLWIHFSQFILPLCLNFGFTEKLAEGQEMKGAIKFFFFFFPLNPSANPKFRCGL